MECPSILTLNQTDDRVKYIEVSEKFQSIYSSIPDFFIRVPGRVNLIGEHIDYCRYPVLPMAIEHDITIAIKCNDDNKLNIRNFDSEKYEDFVTSTEHYKHLFPSGENTSKTQSHPFWWCYVLCGYRGIAEKYPLTKISFDMLVKGTVPPSSGLSSSSALVCAAALATSYANNISLTKSDLASLCAKAEHYIGTEGGGMDQAIGFLAEHGKAKLIEFNPFLKATDVPIPNDVVFVVSNSCVAMNKAATCQFNRRVVECRLATKVIAKAAGLDWKKFNFLSEIPSEIFSDLTKMADVVKKTIPGKVYLKSELCALLEISEDQFKKMLSENTQHLQEFKLADRATHVYGEAARVLAFKNACEEKDVDAQQLGILMNESHRSCRDLYECSHPILDELVNVALDAGAIGSRLTGAGWGGCCISLVQKDEIDNFMKIVTEKFYCKRGLDAGASMFITKPCAGAAIILNSEGTIK